MTLSEPVAATGIMLTPDREDEHGHYTQADLPGLR